MKDGRVHQRLYSRLKVKKDTVSERRGAVHFRPVRKGEWQILGVVTTLTSVLRGQMGHKDVGQMGHMFSITTIQTKSLVSCH